MKSIRTRVLAAVTSVVLATAALAGCGSDATTNAAQTGSTATAVAAAADATQNAATVLAANEGSDAADTTWTADAATTVTLSGTSATVTGDGATGVSVKGGTVTITAAGTYRVTGTLTDGQIVVDAGDADVKLVLDNASVTSSTSAAIAVTAAGNVSVILADGSTNTLSDTKSYAADADINAALYSAADLTIGGSGALTVHGNGNDGITGKDDLTITAGTVTVTAADDGIRGKDSLVVTGGTITVTAGGDGLKADNADDAGAGYVAVSGGTLDITAGGDGIDATTDLVTTGGTIHVDAGSGTAAGSDASTKGLKSGVITVLEGGTLTVGSTDDAVHGDGAVHLNGAALTLAAGDDGVHAETALVVDAGTVDITTSVEGIESAAIVVNGGRVGIVSSDDGLNASGESTATAGGGGGGGGEQVGPYKASITGGTLVINAEGDGFDSNGTAEITGGTVVVNGPTRSGNGALDVNGSFTISGGVLVAAGSAGMVVSPAADSAQGWISATLTGTVPAGTTVQITTADGTVLATFVTAKTIQNIVYSGPGITTGTQYTVRTGGTATGSTVGGLAEGGTLGSSTVAATVTAGQAAAGGNRMGGGRR